MIWTSLKIAFEKDKDFNELGLSPNLLENNDELLPHLLDQLGDEKAIIKALNVYGLPVLVAIKQHQEVLYTNDNFVIIKDEAGLVSAFSTNPFNSIKRFVIENKARDLDVEFKIIGYISPNNSLLNTKTIIQTKDSKELLELILREAQQKNVSDIHIAPRNKNNVAILFRQHGDIFESNINDIPIDDYKKFANKLITEGGGSAGSYSKYFEAQFAHKQNNINLSIRVQQNPTIYKFNDLSTVPSFVLRLHDKSAKQSFKSISELGLIFEQEKALEAIAQRNSGIIIIAGPTGSGKTTALYSILAESIRGRNRIVQTIEDPVEIVIPGIKQCNINKMAGISYENAVRAILRSDVDVALVGEIRSPDTANGVVELDRVGHLVLATIHTKTTFAVVERLKSFGIPSQHIADALSAVVSTRLVKKACPHCSKRSPSIISLQCHPKILLDNPDGGFNVKLSLAQDSIDWRVENMSEKERNLYEENQKTLKQLKLTKSSKHLKNFQGASNLSIINKKGCEECQHGYSGRVLVAETWVVDEASRELITANAKSSEIEKHVADHGNKSIWQHGYELVEQGLTTLESLEDVLPNMEAVGKNYSSDEFDRI